MTDVKDCPMCGGLGVYDDSTSCLFCGGTGEIQT